MKFTIQQEDLKKSLESIIGVCKQNAQLPILGNILIEVDKEIKFTSSDLEIFASSVVKGKIEKEGSFTVNGTLFNNYVNLLPNELIKFELVKNELKIECKNYKTKIKGEEAENYPTKPDVKSKEIFILKFEEFKEAINKVIFSAANNETRIELSGVYFKFEKEKLILATTDSYRLAERKLKGDFKESSFILPKNVFEVMNKYKDTEDIKIILNEGYITLKYGNVILIARLIEGSYPDYKQIISKKKKTSVVIDREELLRAVRASSMLSSDYGDIQIIVSKQSLSINSLSQKGESNVNIDVQSDGENETKVNYKYLVDILNSHKDEKVTMILNETSDPVLFNFGKDDLYLIMSIK